MKKFRAWYLRNQVEITWFLIGFLTMGGLHSLGKGDYVDALISFGIAYINYWANKR